MSAGQSMGKSATRPCDTATRASSGQGKNQSIVGPEISPGNFLRVVQAVGRAGAKGKEKPAIENARREHAINFLSERVALNVLRLGFNSNVHNGPAATMGGSRCPKGKCV